MNNFLKNNKIVILSFFFFFFIFSSVEANSVIWTRSEGNAAHGYPNFKITSPASNLAPGETFKVRGVVEVYTCTNTPANVEMTYGDIDSKNLTYSYSKKNPASDHIVGMIPTDVVFPKTFTAPNTSGTYRIYLTQMVDEGWSAQSFFEAEGYIEFTVEVKPTPIVSLLATPKTVFVGEGSSLFWTSTNADSCTKTMVTSGNLGDSTWSGTAGAAGDKSTKVYTTPGTYVYKISCGGNQYFATTSVEVIPALNAPTVTLLANPSTINGLYTSSIISWVSTDSDLCTKSMVTTGDYNDSGWPLVSNTSKSGEYTSISYSKNGTYTYKIRCTGAGGTAEATTSVLVDAPPLAPPTVTLIANPTNTILGNSSSLVWSSTNAFSCEKSMITRGSYNDSTWSGTTGPGGNQRTKTYVDVGTYTYEIECTGYFGKASTTASVTVSSSTVPDIPGGGSAVTVSLTANPSSVVVGNTSTLSWSSTNANSCAQTMKVGEDDSWNKNNVITLDSQNTRTYTSPGSYTYEITCIGNSGSASATADVTVTNTPIVCEERESCDPEGPCDIATNTQVYECYKESITPGCTVDGTPYNKTNTCVTTVNIYPTCEAQYELETFGKVFVGKRMNWHVSNISPPGTYTVRYKLDPPMSSFAQTDININNSFNIYNTYTYVGTKNFNLEIEMIDYANSIRYVGLCSTSTVAVPYDGTVVER
jgi:hypothetical protein